MFFPFFLIGQKTADSSLPTIITAKKAFLKPYERTYLKKKISLAKPSPEQLLIDESLKAGNNFAQKGDQKAAITEYRKALEIDPKYAGTLYNIGSSIFAMQNYLNAVNYFTQALATDHTSAEIFYARGNAYYKAKEFKKAISDYSSALQMNANDNATYFNRASAYFQIQMKDSACADLLSGKKGGDKLATEYFVKMCR